MDRTEFVCDLAFPEQRLSCPKAIETFGSVEMAPSRRRITSDHDWLEKHLRPLMAKGREIQAIDATLPSSLPVYEKGYWTGLKLILVRYYMPGYLNILSPRTKVAYIDLFAGPGLNLIGDGRVPVPGSPLLPSAMEGTVHQFSSFILCEKREDYARAVRTRLGKFVPQDRLRIHQGDANEFIDELPEILAERDIGHSLVFIDPEGMEFKCDALARLLDTVSCDVIINFPSAGLVRNLTTGDNATLATIRGFLGLSARATLPASEEEAIQWYRSKLASLGKDISTEIVVSAGDVPFHYHLIPAVRKTKGGSDWFRILTTAKERIERLAGDVVGIVSAQIDGRLGVLR